MGSETDEDNRKAGDERKLPSRMPEHVPGKFYVDSRGRRYPADETGQKLIKTTRPQGISTDGWKGLPKWMRQSVIDGDLLEMSKASGSKDRDPASPAVDDYNYDADWAQLDDKYEILEKSVEEMAEFWGNDTKLATPATNPVEPTVESHNSFLPKPKWGDVPHFGGGTRDGKHRNKICTQIPIFNACVARPVPKKEMEGNPECKAAVDKEWKKLFDKDTFFINDVREWSDVQKCS